MKYIGKYKGWEVTQLRQNAWKATKDGLSINACLAKILKHMINENEVKTRYLGENDEFDTRAIPNGKPKRGKIKAVGSTY